MPNWCDNDLTIHGPEGAVETVMALVGLDQPEPEFDFNKVVEYPAGLGFNSGGYDWCIQNWGTKWNACNIVTNPVRTLKKSSRLDITFQTAWAPPTPIIMALAKLFPECKFTLKYYEMGAGYQGELQVQGDETLRESESTYRGHRGG
jgi:hypothetical protein